jgi:hypothetical protein
MEMSYATLKQIGGIVVMVAAAAAIMFNAVLWTSVVPRAWEYPGYLTLQTLFLFALVVVLVRHVERPGVLLLAGSALAIIGLVFEMGFSYYASFAFPILRSQFPDAVPVVLGGPVGTIMMASVVFGIIGNILFYVGVLRAGLLPRWAPGVVIFSQVLGLAMLPYNIPVIVGCVGLFGIGYSMLNDRTEPVLKLQPQAGD